MQADATLETRMANIEAQNRHLRRAVWLVLLTLVALGAIGQAQKDRSRIAGEVETTGLRLVDSDGRTRAKLDFIRGDSSPSLVFYNEEGDVQVRLGMGTDDMLWLSLSKAREQPFQLYAHPNGLGALRLRGSDGTRIELSNSVLPGVTGSEAYLELANEKIKQRVALRSNIVGSGLEVFGIGEAPLCRVGLDLFQEAGLHMNAVDPGGDAASDPVSSASLGVHKNGSANLRLYGVPSSRSEQATGIGITLGEIREKRHCSRSIWKIVEKGLVGLFLNDSNETLRAALTLGDFRPNAPAKDPNQTEPLLMLFDARGNVIHHQP